MRLRLVFALGLVWLLVSCSPARCESSFDCPSAIFACNDGVCEDVSCVTDGDCADGACRERRCAQPCVVDGDCSEILICTGSAWPSCTSFAHACGSDGFCE